MGKRSKEMGTETQWSCPEDDEMESSIIEDECCTDTTEQVRQFYFNLPQPKQLKSRGLARLHENKASGYVAYSLDALIELSQKAEEQEQILKIQAEQRLQQRYKPKILDNKRFGALGFTESRLNLPLDAYLQKTTRSWGEDIAVLEANLKTKKVGYNHQRTKVIKVPLPLTPEQRVDKHWMEDVRKKLQDVQNSAMQKKASVARIKDIRAELSDFDLINRPTYFLHLEKENSKNGNGTEITDTKSKSHHIPDPVMIGCQSARAIYNRLPSMISEESLQTVQEERYFPFSKQPVQSPASDAYKSDGISVLFDVDDAIKDLKKMPETKKFQIDLDPKPGLVPSHEDSMFELNCLRELVDITEGSGWENSKIIMR